LQKEQARRLTTGEHVGALVGVIAGKQHLAEHATNFFG
jgi:hypothetical protein